MDECDFCHSEVATKNYPSRDLRQKGKSLDLCDLCASTPAGNLAFKPWKSPESVDILKTINFAANKILKTLEGPTK